ncbi:MFS transporter [Nocardioides sp. TF02-7]|uniref:MFS transporter n=1 Tax=Nocardioides sp. TF02-7 TaxID=2917724 RepID=UPI001F05962B|nr:MFS transporter [Nocardioides sp. TF02-7]UMG93838.1 MFS transporter [Nocardioides sp. TF02-7]
MLFSTGEGTFMTGSAVFLTQVVGMSAGKVGLAITIAGVAEFLFAYPAGRVVDRLGPKRVWAASGIGRAAAFLALPFVEGFWQYVAVAVVFSAFESLGGSSHQAYVLDVLPPKERVETQAYMYSSLNVGFTLGALIAGVALAFDDPEVIRWTPWFAAALMLLNAYAITRLPAAPHDLRVASGERRQRPSGPGPVRNVGWVLAMFFLGTLWTNQVLLHTVIPLWLVEATDAPTWLLAWLFGTNTVLCIFLPAYTSRGVRNVHDAIRYAWVSTGFFVVSCVITMATHSTAGLLTVVLVWLGHVTVTGAELAISAASWSFQAELMDPRRRGGVPGHPGGEQRARLPLGAGALHVPGAELVRPGLAGDRGDHRRRDRRSRPVGAARRAVPRPALPAGGRDAGDAGRGPRGAATALRAAAGRAGVELS